MSYVIALDLSPCDFCNQRDLSSSCSVSPICAADPKSESDLMAYNAHQHAHLVAARRAGVHAGVLECWRTRGTWKRSPLLIERRLVDPEATGLQVVESRTRVGVLRGRTEEGCFVAKRHLAWVGRDLPTRPA